MKLRVETGESGGGAVVEYEGEGALELAKLVLSMLVPERAPRLALEAMAGPLKVLDWGVRLAPVLKAIRELWPGTTLEDAKKYVEVALLVMSAPLTHTRAEVLERLRAVGVEVE